MKYFIGIGMIAAMIGCNAEDEPADQSVADSPATQVASVDTFMVGGHHDAAVRETPEGESLRLANDSAIENIRLAINGNPNNEESIELETAIVKNPDVGPSFPGGSTAMDKYVDDNLVYPLVAFQNQVRGTVDVRFVVETDGRLTGITVQKSLGYGCDESAIDLIKGMPKWSPGRKGGVNVRCMVVLPLTFQEPNPN